MKTEMLPKGSSREGEDEDGEREQGEPKVRNRTKTKHTHILLHSHAGQRGRKGKRKKGSERGTTLHMSVQQLTTVPHKIVRIARGPT